MDTFTATTPFSLAAGYDNDTTFMSEAEQNRQQNDRSDFVLTGIQPKGAKPAISLIKHKRRNYDNPQAAVGASTQNRIFGNDEKAATSEIEKSTPKDKENNSDCDGASVIRPAAGVPPAIRNVGRNPLFGDSPVEQRETRPLARNPITGEFDKQSERAQTGRFQGNRRNQSSFNNFGTN